LPTTYPEGPIPATIKELNAESVWPTFQGEGGYEEEVQGVGVFLRPRAGWNLSATDSTTGITSVEADPI